MKLIPMPEELRDLDRRADLAPRDAAARALWDAYMEEASQVVADLPPIEREDLLMELASHLADSAMSGAVGHNETDRMRAAIARLGKPRDYLRPMVADSLLERGAATYHPVLLAKGLYQSLFGGLRAFAVGVGFAAGYFLLVVFAVMALFKAAFPRNIGYFIYPDGSRAFGVLANTSGARDALGYWVVPVAILAAAALYVGLTRALRVVRARGK